MSAFDIAKHMSPETPASSVSTHLAVLFKHGFVTATRGGQGVTYSIDEAGFRAVEEFLRLFSDR